MKILKRILLGLLVLIVLVLIAGYILLNNLKNSAVPEYNKNVEIPGLTNEVTVLRDSFGIPHIYAENEPDLYRAVGFAMAQDRLWQMDLLRRLTKGQLSEILGKDQVKTDLLMRALRIEEKSEKILKSSDPDIISALQAYADGINFYIDNFPLPPEFKILGYKPEHWKPVHSFNLIGYMSWDLTSGWETEILLSNIGKEVSEEQISEMIPDMKNQNTAIYPEFKIPQFKPEQFLLSADNNLKKLGVEIFNGSNNWAVSGKKSKTGKPLLANDMHLGLFAPGIWYQIHENVAGKLNVTGLAVPGQPFVIAGHNDSIAWGMTNVMVDDIDFYAEKLNEDSTKYRLDGQWKDLLIKNESIKTKEGLEINEILRFTHRGPIVNRFKPGEEVPLSIRWLGNEISNEIRTVYLLNRAKNWSDFRDAVKTFKSVSQNIVYADVAGNIGLQCSAGVPVREGNGIEIYPGDTSLYDWQGLVPFEELPYEFNPERGFVSSANNKTVPEDYPYYISHWFATPSRIDRIREMLQEKELLGTEDFERMQRDFTSKTAEEYVPEFLNALKTKKTWSDIQLAALQKLQSWNCKLSRESQAASIFEILYRNVMENLVKDDLSPENFQAIKGERVLLENLLTNIIKDKTSKWIDDVITPEKESFADIVILSFKETVEELKTKLGQDVESWNWEKIHQFTLSHPLGVVKALDRVFSLNRGPFGMPGSYHTVCPYSYSFNKLYNVTDGASHRHILNPANWDDSETIIPTGTSGIPASDFYLDQTKLYIENKYHADPFSLNAVQKAARFKMKLEPKINDE